MPHGESFEADEMERVTFRAPAPMVRKMEQLAEIGHVHNRSEGFRRAASEFFEEHDALFEQQELREVRVDMGEIMEHVRQLESRLDRFEAGLEAFDDDGSRDE